MLLFLNCNSQRNSLTKNVIDTINLKKFNSRRVVSYKLELATIFLSYDDFKTSIIGFTTVYKNDRPIKFPRSSYRVYKNAKKKSLKILNNIIDELNRQIKISDTVVLVHKELDGRTLWRWQLNGIITSQIERNNCAIADGNNNMQFTIIRDKGPWSWGRGGRRYYFPGNNIFFIDQMDWIK